MRQETLLKVIIAVFAIILLILATFVYGNMQRADQRNKTTQSTNQTTLETPKQTEKPPANTSKPEAPKTTQTKPTVTPAPVPAPTPTAPAKAEIPKAGGEAAVLPMTILSVLAYLVYKGRRPAAIISKSTLH